MLDNVLAVQQLLVLVVLAAPFAAALLCALVGNRRPALVKRLAMNFAVVQLALMGALAAMTYPALDGRASESCEFRPYGVPGDAGFGEIGLPGHATTWALLRLGPAPEGLVGKPVSPTVQFYVGIDGLNLTLVLLTGVMTLVAVFASPRVVTERLGGYYAWIFALSGAVVGAFLAFDVVLFYVFFELTLIPAFFLIGGWGTGAGRREAAGKFFLYTLLGSLFTLTGLIGVVLTHPTPMDGSGKIALAASRSLNALKIDPVAGPITFSIPRLMQNVSIWSIYYAERARAGAAEVIDAESQDRAARGRLAATPDDPTAAADAERAGADLAGARLAAAKAARTNRTYERTQAVLFFLMMCGFAVKIPIVPFHTWLPAAYNEAPLPVTMLLSALLAKLGTFGVLRVVIPLAPGPALEYGLAVFGALGAAGIVYAALCAFAQRDLKMVTAYSSVSHLGFLVIALFTGTREGFSGAALHMVNHGLSTGAMFALLCYLQGRYRTTDSAQYGGLMGHAPAFSFLMMLACLASIGVPFLNNFVSEMLMLAGLFEPSVVRRNGYGLAIAAASGIFLSAWYTMTLLRRSLFGPHRLPETADAASPAKRGLDPAEWVAFGLPVLLCVVLGVFPQPALSVLEGDSATLTNHLNLARYRARLPLAVSPDLDESALPPRR